MRHVSLKYMIRSSYWEKALDVIARPDQEPPCLELQLVIY